MCSIWNILLTLIAISSSSQSKSISQQYSPKHCRRSLESTLSLSGEFYRVRHQCFEDNFVPFSVYHQYYEPGQLNAFDMPGLVIDELRTDRESRDEYSAYVTYNDMPGFLKCTYHTDLQDNEIDTLQELNQLDIAIPKLPNWPGYTEPIPFQSMIAQLLTHFTTADGYGCVVLELIDGIRLNDYMSELGLLERIVEMRDIVRQLLIVLIYLNYVGWSHGDIKPKNIMVQVLPPRMDRKPHVRIVLVDFNMAAPITYGPFYPYGHAIGLTPPEYYLYKPIDMQQYDSWTLGATIYTLITGEAPYEIDYTGEFSITWPFKERRDFMFSLMEHQQHIYTRISYHRELQDFIDLLMQIDPAKRLTPEEIMWHNWLK